MHHRQLINNSYNASFIKQSNSNYIKSIIDAIIKSNHRSTSQNPPSQNPPSQNSLDPSFQFKNKNHPARKKSHCKHRISLNSRRVFQENTSSFLASDFPSEWAVMRRCFDIDLRIQHRLSILMARDGDSARCMAHVFLMILVVPRSTYRRYIVIVGYEHVLHPLRRGTV